MPLPKRDLTYAILVAALEEGGCFLCNVRLRATLGMLKPILTEFTNDPGVRGEIRKSRGFCAHHTWLMYDIARSDPLIGDTPVAILYRDLLHQGLEDLRGAADGGPRPRRTRGRWAVDPGAGSTRCACCQQEDSREADYSRLFLKLLELPGFQGEFEASDALCIRHALRVMKAAESREARDLILRHQLKRLEELDRDLAELLRKRDYRFHGEPWGREADAWVRALEVQAGKGRFREGSGGGRG